MTETTEKPAATTGVKLAKATLSTEPAPTLEVRTCGVCNRTTVLSTCPTCGHDPERDADAVKRRALAKAA